MTNPQDLGAMTLSALREARDKLESAEWALAMDAATAEERRDSGLLLGQVHGEILRLENLQLAKIVDALQENGAALESAAADVKKEVKRVAKVAKVLKTIEKLVKLAIKIAPRAVGLMGSVRRSPAPGSILARRLAGPAAARPKAKTKPKAKAKTKPAATKARPKSAARRSASRAAPKRKAGPRRRAR